MKNTSHCRKSQPTNSQSVSQASSQASSQPISQAAQLLGKNYAPENLGQRTKSTPVGRWEAGIKNVHRSRQDAKNSDYVWPCPVLCSRWAVINDVLVMFGHGWLWRSERNWNWLFLLILGIYPNEALEHIYDEWSIFFRKDVSDTDFF